MSAVVMDGSALSRKIRQELAGRVAGVEARTGRKPRLDVVLVGEDPASATYVRMKNRACEAIGMLSAIHELPAGSTQQQIEDLVQSLNENPEVTGILVQHPVPEHLDEQAILDLVSPNKDVDGISTTSLGRLMTGLPGFRSCTPKGIIRLLDEYSVPIKGASAVVVGRSIILGKPVALLLLERHATVTICHSRTRNLPDVCRGADIIVAALGKAEFIQADWLKPGCAVMDAGYNRVVGRDGDVGDVDFSGALSVAGHITPVPGGVGPMTIAMLLENTVEAAETAAGTQ